MQEKITTVIIDDNRQFVAMVKEYLEKQEEVKVVGTACDGREGVELIKEVKPDVALVDMVMPNLDGLGLLKEVSKLTEKPKIIMTSAVSQEEVIAKTMQLGAHFYMIKPFSFDTLIERIVAFASADEAFEKPILYADSNTPGLKKFSSLESSVTNMIITIGIPPNIKGYKFIRDAIMMILEDQDLINAITKQLYPNIAKLNNTTPTRVERAIRHAIEVAWNRGDYDTLNQLFGFTIKNTKGKPTNGEFIAMIADRLRLQLA